MTGGEEEAEGEVHALGDADAGGDADFALRVAVVEDAEYAFGEVGSVEGAGDAEGAGEFAGAVGGGQGGRWGEGFEGSDEDAARGAVRFADDVETFIHAVDEVDVGVAGWAEDDAGSVGDAGCAVRGEVAFAEVGFDFDDASAERAVHQDFA